MIFKKPTGLKLNMLNGKYLKFYNHLLKFIPKERLIKDTLRTYALGTDASFYRLTPKIVVKVINPDEVKKVIILSKKLKIPITFRASGTSLSGQSISDSVLIKVDGSWKNYHINEDASQITMDPGILGGFVNLYLSKYNKKIGPDPASINAAMIGGIAANNSSGMTSGVKYNIYNTLIGMEIIFTDGSILNTTDKVNRKNFRKNHAHLLTEISEISDEVKANGSLADRIKKKFSMKNTTGYSINALIDFEDPIDIIQHLIIGSEGTLGFISNITLKTVPSLPYKATALIIFKNIHSASEAIPELLTLSIDAAEIMDRTALHSVENKPGMPSYLKSLDEQAAALLIETSSDSTETLQIKINQITDFVSNLNVTGKVEFTTDKTEYIKLWNVRKGLFTSVSKNRKPGTTVVIEDLNFPANRLDEAVLTLQNLFKKYDYQEAIIWGHALSGNLHFVIYQDFSKSDEIKRYESFINEITKTVIEKFDGSLKAEHGTGRNMAPFVEYEWGKDAYEIMKKIKKIFDPDNLLNPGVLINSDNQVHLKNLKLTPASNEIIDKCIECGFCENVCPSKDITITPRQRIALWREITHLENTQENYQRLSELKNSFKYHGDYTCATDGLCALSCPVDIDTGKFIKKIREENLADNTKKFAELIARHLKLVTESGRIGLNILDAFHSIFGSGFMEYLTDGLRKISNNHLPKWSKTLPKGANAIYPGTATNQDKLTVVYFPSCINRTMGIQHNSSETESETTVMHRLLTKAGYKIKYPDGLKNLCCGMPFRSKGLIKQADKKAEGLRMSLLYASQNGKFPIVYDMSPCLKTTKEYLKTITDNRLEVYDITEFIHDFLLDKLEIKKIDDTIAVHPVCSVVTMGIEDKLKAIAQACANKVVVPENITCCGFAGDRGFTFPELNASALKELKTSLPANCRNGYSTSRTCEIGLSLHSRIEYKSIVYLVDKVSKTK